jgi:hypothetical protein
VQSRIQASPASERLPAYPHLKIGVALLCGVAVPCVYLFGRLHHWRNLWHLAPGEHAPDMAVSFALLALLALGTWWVAASRRSFDRLTQAIAGRRSVLVFIAILMLWGFLAWNERIIGIHGDGLTWERLAGNPFIMTSEPFGRWMHYIAFRLLSILGAPTGMQALRMASVAAGTIQLLFILLLTPRIFGSLVRALPWIVYLFVTPLLVLNLGYSETTPIAYAFLMAHLLATVLYVEGPMARPPTWEGMLLALAIWSHGAMCFASGGYAVVLIWWLFGLNRSSDTVRKRLRFSRIAGAVVLSILPFSLLLGTLTVAALWGTGLPESGLASNLFGGFGGGVVALSQTGNPYRYSIFSVRYLRDILNLMLSVCPMLMVAPMAFFAVGRRHKRTALYLGATLGGSLVLTLFWNADLGIQNDLDLLSPFAMSVSVVTALWLGRDGQFGMRGAFAAFALAVTAFVFMVLPYVAPAS